MKEMRKMYTRLAAALLLFSSMWSVGEAEILSTLCHLEGDQGITKFLITANTTTKIGETDFPDPQKRKLASKATSRLKVLSSSDFKDGLVGVKLVDPATGTSYRVDFVKEARPSKSPYTKEMSSVAVTYPGGRTRASCGFE